jgi:hypothetical protein
MIQLGVVTVNEETLTFNMTDMLELKLTSLPRMPTMYSKTDRKATAVRKCFAVCRGS